MTMHKCTDEPKVHSELKPVFPPAQSARALNNVHWSWLTSHSPEEKAGYRATKVEIKKFANIIDGGEKELN